MAMGGSASGVFQCPARLSIMIEMIVMVASLD